MFDPDTGREKFLNSAGLGIWEAMDGVARGSDLALILAAGAELPVSDEILTDVATFGDGLVRDGLAIASQSPLAAPLASEAWVNSGDAPNDLDLSLTGRCNLSCTYCFYANEMSERRDLSTESWLKFLDEMRPLAIRSATLSGGELFMRRDLWALVDAVIAARMRYSVLSNGTLITEATLEQFSSGARRNRLNSIQISIDGSRPEVHDASRGVGSFERAVRGLRLLMEAGFPMTVRVTINRQNVDDLEGTAGFLLETIGLKSFSCNEAIPMGSGCTRKEESGLTPAEQVRAMRALERLTNRYPGRIQATAGPLANLKKYREMERARETGWRADSWQMGVLGACGCAFNKLSLHHDGVIAPCNMLEIELGRIDRDRLTDIWQGHPILREMRERKRVSMASVPECSDCEWGPVCNGSCPATAYSRTGTLTSASLDDCYREFLKGIDEDDRRGLFQRPRTGEPEA